jgi:hypothetical protein
MIPTDVSETISLSGQITTKCRNNTDPVRSLANAVIVRAIEDMEAKEPQNKAAKSYPTMYKSWQGNMASARNFIFGNNMTLDFWCTAAQVDIDYLRQKLIHLTGGRVWKKKK